MSNLQALLLFIGLLLVASEIDDLGKALGNVKVNQTTTWTIRATDSTTSTRATAKALEKFTCALGYCPPDSTPGELQ